MAIDRTSGPGRGHVYVAWYPFIGCCFPAMFGRSTDGSASFETPIAIGDGLRRGTVAALLGAVGLGDIGRHFPDTSPQYENIDSRILLRHAADLIKQAGYRVSNADLTLIAQKPKMVPYIAAMIQNIAKDLELDTGDVNVKATTTEYLGFTGREEGIAAMAVVLLTR